MRSLSKILLLLIAFLSSINFAQGQYFYIPDNDTNLLQAKDQGDFLLGIAAPRNERFNFQLGYSPFQYVSLMGGYYQHAQENQQIRTEGSNYTGAIGLYRNIQKLDKHSFFLTKHLKEVLLYANLGISFGKNEINILDRYKTNLNHQNIFLRSGINLDFRYFSFGFSTKYYSLNFQDVSFIGNPNDVTWFINRLEEDVREKDPRSLNETMFRIKYLGKRFEIYTDINTISGRKERDLNRSYFIVRTYNLGLIVKLNQLFVSKK